MPYSFDFDSKNDILRCRLHGRVTDDTLKEFFRTGAEHAIRTHPSVGVVDFTEVTSFEASAEAIEEVARSKPVLRAPNLRRIIIAPPPEVYGMMRMFEIHGEETRPDLLVVRVERDAWATLAVVNPRFEPIEEK